MIGGKVNTTRSSAPAKSRVACAASPKPIQTLGLAVSSFALTFAAHAELGEDVFNNTCSACHAGGKNSVIPEKTLNKAALEQYLAGGFKVDSIITQVTNGKGAMPAWGNVLDEDEIVAVANYVFDSANAGKW